MIRPLTPTRAGWAQSFDTSGIVQAAYEERENRRKRFEKNIKEFDPSSVWYRDIPEFSKKVNQYYSFISDNYDKLTSKSRNIDTWQEMKSMENDLLNFSAASKSMGAQVKQAQNLMLQRPDLYDTAENRKLIDDRITGAAWGSLEEGYKTGEAHNNTFMNQFARNIHLDTTGMTKQLMAFGEEDIQNPETALIGEKKDIQAYKYPIQYDMEGLSNQIRDWWENGYMSGTTRITGEEIQRKFNGDVEAFAQKVAGGLPEYSDPKERSLSKDSQYTRRPSQFDVSIRPSTRRVRGSSESEQQVGGVKIMGKTIGGTTEYKTVKYNYPTYSQGGVTLSGTQTAYRWNAGAGGFDMDGAVYSTTKLAEDGRMVLTGVDHGAVAQYPVTFKNLKLYDDQGNVQEVKNYTAKKGQPLSPEMVAAINANQASIVDDTGKTVPLNRYNAESYVYVGQVAYSQSLPNAGGIDFDDPTSFMNALDDPGARQIAMPWDDFKSQSTIGQADIEAIEAGLGTYDYQKPFATVAPAPAGDLDAQIEAAALEAARVAAGQ